MLAVTVGSSFQFASVPQWECVRIGSGEARAGKGEARAIEDPIYALPFLPRLVCDTPEFLLHEAAVHRALATRIAVGDWVSGHSGKHLAGRHPFQTRATRTTDSRASQVAVPFAADGSGLEAEYAVGSCEPGPERPGRRASPLPLTRTHSQGGGHRAASECKTCTWVG